MTPREPFYNAKLLLIFALLMSLLIPSTAVTYQAVIPRLFSEEGSSPPEGSISGEGPFDRGDGTPLGWSDASRPPGQLGQSEFKEDTTPPAEDEDSAFFQLSETEAVVYTYEAMKAALQSDTITAIYLGDDIVSIGGITVSTKKTSLLIEGINPLDAEQTMHTYTDYRSADIMQTIYIPANTSFNQATICNLKVEGKNHYGFVTVPDGNVGFTIYYENVVYQGPQMTYNRNGTAYYIDCDITIGRFDSPTEPGECGELRHAYLGGDTTIIQTTAQGNEFFFIEAGAGSITVMEGADVSITSAGDSGLVFMSVASTLRVEREGKLQVSTQNRIWEGTAFSSVTVEEGGQLFLHVRGTTLPYGLLAIGGDLLVEEDGVFHLTTNATSLLPLLRFGYGGGAEFNNPRSVLLQHSANRPILYDPAGKLELGAQQLNYWRTAGPGGFDDLPLYGWRKANGEPLSAKGTVSSGTAGNFALSSSNYEPDDTPPDTPIDGTTFNMSSARTIAFGNLPLLAYYQQYKDEEPSVAVHTGEEAIIQAEYFYNGDTIVLAENSIADAEGYLEIPTGPDGLPQGAVVTVRSSHWHLYEKTVFVVGSEGLMFAAHPEPLVFGPAPLSATPQEIGRKNPDWNISVYDSRGPGSQWTLLVRLFQPFTPEDAEDYAEPLANALILRLGDSTHTLSDDENLPIYTHRNTRINETTTVSWSTDQGVLARIAPGAAVANVQYEAILLWTLQNAP